MKVATLILSFFMLIAACNQKKNCFCSKGKTSKSLIEDLEIMTNLDSAKLCSRECNKPLLIFFTGWTGVSCRKMEAQIFTDNTIKKIVSNEYVMVALFCDEQTPIKNGGYSDVMNRKITKTGEKYLDYQLSKFKSNVQPFFAILDTNQNTLGSFHYEPEISKVEKYLQDALDLFANQ